MIFLYKNYFFYTKKFIYLHSIIMPTEIETISVPGPKNLVLLICSLLVQYCFNPFN